MKKRSACGLYAYFSLIKTISSVPCRQTPAVASPGTRLLIGKTYIRNKDH
jgi:hypothetical protein